MDEFTANAFVNRDKPIPVIDFDPSQDLSEEEHNDGAQTEGKRDRLRRPATNLEENVRKVQGKLSEAGGSLQDRLLEKCVLPCLYCTRT
jgi:hypothetical protein